MQKFKPVFIALFVVITIVILGYAYTIFSGRYSQKSSGNMNTNENQSSITDKISDYLRGGSDNSNINNNGNSVETFDSNVSGSNDNENINSNANTNDNVDLSEPTSKDCDNNCSRLKNSGDKFRYCQQICGDVPVSKKNSEADCVNLNGLDGDACWRDLAVSKLDASFCAKISDKKLQTVCRNRVSEELLN